MEKQDEGQSLSLKDVYTEMGVNYRYFLSWRQRLLAGYLAAVAALAIAYAWTYKEAKSLSWVVLATGSGLTIVFWALDYRNRDLYHIIIEKDEYGYYAYCPELEGCQTQGDTLEEVMDNIKEAIELYDEAEAELQPEFAASLKRSLEQASSGEGVDLETFRKQIEQ